MFRAKVHSTSLNKFHYVQLENCVDYHVNSNCFFELPNNNKQ